MWSSEPKWRWSTTRYLNHALCRGEKLLSENVKTRNLSLYELVIKTKERIYMAKRTRALLRERDNLSLTTIKLKNPSCLPSECLKRIISRLTDIQLLLPSEYRYDTIFRNKLLDPVRDVVKCRPAYHKPAKTVQGLISNLYALLAPSNNFAGSPSLH